MTHVIPINQTASLGIWSFNTQKFTENVYLRQIIVKAAQSGGVDTGFHFYIQDGTKDSNLIFDTRTEGKKRTGTLRRECNIPLVGIHTIGVIGSNQDVAFTGKLVISEGRINAGA